MSEAANAGQNGYLDLHIALSSVHPVVSRLDHDPRITHTIEMFISMLQHSLDGTLN
jgi:hypothetical protein